jgi:hypothetical protein
MSRCPSKRLYVMSGLFLAGLLLALPQRATPQQSQAGSTIKVTLDYTGTGTVDENHKIFVALWDSPAFVQGSVRPIAVQSTSSKTGTVTFSDVKANPAYVSCAYDPTGKWDGQSGPPPAGASLGMYSTSPGKPEPIDTAGGKTTTAAISFDDSVKMH